MPNPSPNPHLKLILTLPVKSDLFPQQPFEVVSESEDWPNCPGLKLRLFGTMWGNASSLTRSRSLFYPSQYMWSAMLCAPRLSVCVCVPSGPLIKMEDRGHDQYRNMFCIEDERT